MNSPFDHPHDTSYEDGKQRVTYRLPMDFLFAEADDGVLIAMDVCESDGLSDEELDRIAEEKVTEYEQRKVTRSGSQVVTNKADEPLDVGKLIEHLKGDQ